MYSESNPIYHIFILRYEKVGNLVGNLVVLGSFDILTRLARNQFAMSQLYRRRFKTLQNLYIHSFVKVIRNNDQKPC